MADRQADRVVEVKARRAAIKSGQIDKRIRHERRRPILTTVEFHGRLLCCYDVTYIPGTDRLREVKSPTLFETPYVLPQLRLFELDDTEWLKDLKVGEYALRRLRRPQALQDVLFSYTKAH